MFCMTSFGFFLFSRLETILHESKHDQSIQEELNKTIEALENDTKTFEDLEFQYLEEETDWLAYREELQNELKSMSQRLEEKQQHIGSLENQSIDNQNTACTDTKNIEKDLWTLLNDLEKRREELKAIDKHIFDISGQPNSQSESEDDFERPNRNRDVMSQSLFGSQEILSSKPHDEDCMSKSVNENMFFHNNIESRSPFKCSTPSRTLRKIDISDDITQISQSGHEHLKRAEEIDGSGQSTDPMTKLKYNLSPPFQHKKLPDTSDSKQVNLNLSIESDDFEVNPLEKRVPSQDDIDRICKVTLDAPISTQGASDKVIESIKEIERNRQLLLAQQGKCVVILYLNLE